MRIEVPVMDFSIPKLPWAITQQDVENLRYLDDWAGRAKKKWRGIKSIEIDMLWAPFTRESAARPRERIEDTEGSVQQLLVTEEDCASAEEELFDSLISLTIGEDETAEVLDYALLENKQMTEVKSKALPERKRKQLASDPLADLFKKKRKPVVTTGETQKPKENTEDKIMFDGFSAASALDAFMRSRGVIPAPPIDTPRQKMPPPTLPVKAALLPSTTQPTTQPLPYPAAPAPAPNLPPADFIVSTTLLSERSIFRSIKLLYPAARFIERDFLAVVHAIPTLGPGSGRIVVSDADLIVSPTSGLILTTLRRLCIRSPLQGGTPPTEYGRDIKTRMIEVSKRFEHLQVLIRAPLKVLSPSDAKGLSGFMEFAASLEAQCKVEPRLVADTEEEIVRWIVAAMKSHSHRLVEEESEWEVFLRQGGLNTMAAQVLLQASGHFGGIQAILDMPDEERRARFAGLVGDRVLARTEDWLNAGRS